MSTPPLLKIVKPDKEEDFKRDGDGCRDGCSVVEYDDRDGCRDGKVAIF